ADENYQITYWNRAAELLYGWRAEETIGKFGPDITKTEFPNENPDEMQRQIREQGFWRGEVTQIKKDGTRFPSEISSLLLRDENGKITGYVSLNHDITERKQAEADLRRREQEFRSLADNIPDIISRFDRQLRHIYINDVIESVAGQPSESFMGKTNLELGMPSAQVRIWRDSLRQVFESGKSMAIEFEFPSVAGLRSFESRLVPEFGPTGDVESVLSIARDITGRKQAEQQTQLQIQRLKALRAIDVAISSSFNLNLTLSILLDQVIGQLNVNAASILLFDSIVRGLEYGASRGFLTSYIREAKVRLGEGYAGKAVLERRTIHIENLMQRAEELPPAFLKMLQEEGFREYYCVPLIVKGEAKGVLEIFHRSALDTNLEWLDFLETLAGQAAIAIEDSTLFENLQRSNQELFQAYDATIEGWSHALDLRDRETEGHTLRVTELSVDLARHFDFTEEQLIYVRWGALLHDIGKMGVPDSILLKPAKLTDVEWEIMRQHPTFAFEMLSPITFLKTSVDIPYCHHEKWDGTGYPRVLKGDVIPLAARLFAVVDVWDAVTSDRPYRRAWSKEEAAQYLREQSGKHFDPHVVNVFLNSIARM
ncbi:MAG TPA: HD domain-containing phosphohydrolase, partial [Anaerolineales bacterium]|nr:HD domain-containing phosphohydrolase [Anaerolineales bacterium]